MSKVKSEQVFNLIKSLSKGEKRFFTLYAARLSNSQDKKFIILYKAIEKQKVYDEEVVLKQNKTLNPKQFSNLKAHLYFQLLRSIRLCNSSNLENIKITELLDYARILYNKCLYKECIKMIDKAKSLAIENDRSVMLLEILEIEKLVIPKTIESGNEKRVNKVIVTTNQVAQSVKNINIFSNLSLKLDSYYRQKGFVKSEEDLENVSVFFKESLPIYDETKLSFQEKMYLYSSFVGFYFFIQDFSNGHEYAVKWVNLFEQQPEMKRHKLEMYIKALNRLLTVQNKLFKFKEFTETQKQLVSIKRDKSLYLTENINLNLFKAIYMHEMNRHFMLGEFNSGTRIVRALEDELTNFIPKLDKHSILLMYYKIACLFLGSGNYKKAVFWLNKIHNEREIELREDIHAFTRILLLVAHFELGNDQLVDVNIRSSYRYFSKKGILSHYQLSILNFLKHLFLSNSERDLRKQFYSLKLEMQVLETNKFEKRAFLYFDIISWLESKIENKTIQEVIKEKAKIKIAEN